MESLYLFPSRTAGKAWNLQEQTKHWAALHNLLLYHVFSFKTAVAERISVKKGDFQRRKKRYPWIQNFWTVLHHRISPQVLDTFLNNLPATKLYSISFQSSFSFKITQRWPLIRFEEHKTYLQESQQEFLQKERKGHRKFSEICNIVKLFYISCLIQCCKFLMLRSRLCTVRPWDEVFSLE